MWSEVRTEKRIDQMPETATSNDEKQSAHVNQLQDSSQLTTRLEQLESEMQHLKQGTQDQLQNHLTDTRRVIKEEFGRLMEEERKSLISGQRLSVELNNLKLSLESNSKHQLDALGENLQQQRDAARSSSRSLQQQLDTAKHDFSQQLDKVQGRVRKMWILVVSVLVVFVAMNLRGVDFKSWSFFQRGAAVTEDRRKVESEKEVALKHFTDGIYELQRAFPSQSSRFWRIIEAATLPIIEEDNPTHPAVVMLVAAKGRSSVAECLARHYAQLVTESLRAAAHVEFDCESYADSDPAEANRKLDSVLTRAFDDGSKSGVVLRLEKLPGPAPMIFYRFADNDNAPYKNVAIVLTLTLEATDTGSERDSVAYNELRKVWASSLDTDKLEPLLSRIGNSIAFVRPETKETLARLKC